MFSMRNISIPFVKLFLQCIEKDCAKCLVYDHIIKLLRSYVFLQEFSFNERFSVE